MGARLVAHTDQVVSKTLDYGRGLGCLDRRGVLCNQDSLLRLNEHTAVRLMMNKAR